MVKSGEHMQAVWGKGLLHEMNVTIAFQYNLVPDGDTMLDLAASNLYRLFINGVLVGYGPARAAHGYSRVDSYSLAGWCGKETVITVEVHSANVNTYYVTEERPFFAAEIRSGDRMLADASNFAAYHMQERVQKVRRFSFQRSFTEIYHLTGNPGSFYGGNTVGRTPIETEPVHRNQLMPRYVNYPKLGKLPGTVVEQGDVERDPEAEPWRDRAYSDIHAARFKGYKPQELEEDSGEEAGQFRYLAQETKEPVLGAMTYRIYDFGRTLTGFFAMHVSAKASTVFYVLFDEVLEDCGTHHKVSPFRNTCCNVLKYTMPAGEYDLVSFEANSARFSTVVVTEGCADFSEYGMIRYENPDASAFVYDYGDSDLNQIVEAAVHTFAQNAVDILTDCPSRERAGWLCDSYFSSRSEALFTGKNLVERNFLENYALSPQSPFLPKGMIPMCYPADHNDGIYIPNWSMWYILELYSYWKRTGDASMLELSKDKVYGLVDFFGQYVNEYGLLENLESWVFIEWSMCNDPEYTKGINFPSNMLWAAALEAGAKMYGEPTWAEAAASMKSTIRDLSWNGTFFEENSVRDEQGKLIRTGHTTETGQYYAFYFQTASREAYPELFERMRTEFGPRRDAANVYPTVYPSNAIVGNYLRLEILLQFGYVDQVLAECRDFFLDMAKTTGTLWEHSRLSASLNHGFASLAAVYIDECIRKKRENQ